MVAMDQETENGLETGLVSTQCLEPDSHPPARPSVSKILQSPKIVLPAGEQVFQCKSQKRTFSIQTVTLSVMLTQLESPSKADIGLPLLGQACPLSRIQAGGMASPLITGLKHDS